MGTALARTDNTLDLDVRPDTDTNPTGTTHTLIARVDDDGDGLVDAGSCAGENCQVDFEIESGPDVTISSGAGSGSGGSADGNSPTTPDMTCTVNAADDTDNPATAWDDRWECVVQFTSATAGTNVIRAWVDDDFNDATVDADAGEGLNPGTAVPAGGQPDEGGTATGTGAGDRSETDDTDVVNKSWFASIPAGTTLDCDDESGNAQTTGAAATTDDNQINPVGQAETYTCRVTSPDGADAGTERDPVANIKVDGENQAGANDPDNSGATGVADYNDFCTTDATGTCTGSISGAENEAGSATICFWTDEDADTSFATVGDANDGGNCAAGEAVGDTENDDTTDEVLKTWAAAGSGRTLDATPELDNNLKGTSHTVTATVVDQFGNPVAGLPVDFDVEGRNDGTVDATEAEGDDVITNANGVATFTYTDDNSTVTDPYEADTITVCVDTDNIDDCGAEAAADKDSVEKRWFNTVPTPGRVDLDMAPAAELDDSRATDEGCPAGGDFDATAGTNQVTDEHEICASVFDAATGGNTVGGETVTFTITGPGFFTNDADANLGQSFTATTDGSGDAYALINSEETGTTTVTATTSNGKTSSGTKVWDNDEDEARNISCDPDTASNPPGTTHVVTCDITDQFGNGVPGADVTVTETGAGRFDTAAPVAADANGQIEIVVSTTANETGTQTITATLSGDTRPGAGTTDDACEQAAGVLDASEKNGPGTNAAAPAGNCADTVEKVWEEQPTTQCSDGVDNDGDGWVDFPDDPGCDDAADDDESNEPIVTQHSRTAEITRFKHIDLPGKKKPALMVKGVVTVDDGFDACANQVPVKVQIRASGEWITRKTDSTNENGVFKVLVRHVHAKYRVVAPAVDLADEHGDIDQCLKASDGARYDH